MSGAFMFAATTNGSSFTLTQLKPVRVSQLVLVNTRPIYLCLSTLGSQVSFSLVHRGEHCTVWPNSCNPRCQSMSLVNAEHNYILLQDVGCGGVVGDLC